MTSETRIAYGSRVLRQGRSRPFARYQAKSAPSTGERLLATAVSAGEERVSLRTAREHRRARAWTQNGEILTAGGWSGQPQVGPGGRRLRRVDVVLSKMPRSSKILARHRTTDKTRALTCCRFDEGGRSGSDAALR